MTLPVDTAGNPRIDMSWGNLPIQPDDQRQNTPTQTITVGGSQNVAWTNYGTLASAKLSETNFSVTLNQLTQSVEPDQHVIQYELWDAYPAGPTATSSVTSTAPSWSQYSFDGTIGVFASSTIVAVPSVVGLNKKGAVETLHIGGLDVGTITTRTTGATPANHGTVYSQSVSPVLVGSSTTTQGTAVNLVFYYYQDATTPGVVPANGYVAG
jgi:hypothetical protein